MAYSLLGKRYTYWVASGGSSPEEYDIRAFGKAYYDQTTEDLSNNRSRIKLEYGVVVNGNEYSGTYTLTAVIQKKVNNTWTNVQTKTYTKSSGSYENVGERVKDSITDAFIPHDNDGNAQVRVSVTISNTVWSGRSRSYTYTYDLPQINVTSTITNNTTQSSPIDFGSNVTFTITSPNADVTHTLTYTVGGTTTTIGTGIGTSVTYAFPTSLVNSFTGTENPTIYVTCTSSNGTTTGTTVYLHVPNTYVPAVTLTLQEASTMPSGISVYVKGKSKIKGTVTPNMSNDGGATVTSYKTPINGTTYNTATFTTELLTGTGSQSVTSTIVDSRGRTATNTKTFTIYDYFTPTISNYSVKRCNSSGVVDEEEGTYGLIQFTYNIAALNNQNAKSVQVTCNGVTKTINLSNYSGTYTGTSNLFSGLSLSNSYNVTFKVIDSFNSSGIAYSFTITPAYTTMSMRSGGKGISFGQIATADDFRVYMDAYFYGKMQGIYPVGAIYMSTTSTNPSTYFGGTWAQIKDRFLLAAGDTYSAGDTGGNSTHTHTMNHTHTLNDAYAKINMSASANSLYGDVKTDVTEWQDNYRHNLSSRSTSSTTNTRAIALGGATDNSSTTNTGSASNLPPYLTVYVWRRTQ